MEFVAPRSVVAAGSQDHRVACSRHGLDVSAGPTRCVSVRRPLQARTCSFILPRAFRLLQSATACDLPVVPRNSLATTTRPTSASRGVPSLIAASTSGVHHPPGNPNPRVMFPPRRFSRPRGFAPPPAFAGLFHPAATSRVCPPGVCPSPRSRTGFPRPNHALVPLNASACGLTRASLCALAFRALLPALSAVSSEAV